MIGDIFKRIARQVVREGISSIIKRVMKRSPTVPPVPKTVPSPKPVEHNKEHPWRRCGEGRHWVTLHIATVPASSSGPAHPVNRGEFCQNNPTRKKGHQIQYLLSQDESVYIRDTFFNDLTGAPQAGRLSDFKNSDTFDPLIRGWTKYWNEVFEPIVPLDPDLFKALIASESGFELHPREIRVADPGRGLAQLTEATRIALSDPDGELKNHLVKLDPADVYDPNLAICGAVRWLFRKQRLASGKLGRNADWVETIADYKGCLNDYDKTKDDVPHAILPFFKLLRKQKK